MVDVAYVLRYIRFLFDDFATHNREIDTLLPEVLWIRSERIGGSDHQIS